MGFLLKFAFILFLVIEIFIGTIIILWEINSSTRKECASRRNRQPFLHAHIMSTTENKKYDILLWMSWIESNIESVESSRTELWISKSKLNRIESNMEWIESNRILIAIFILFSVSDTEFDSLHWPFSVLYEYFLYVKTYVCLFWMIV